MAYESLHAGARGGVWDRQLPELPLKPVEPDEVFPSGGHTRP